MQRELTRYSDIVAAYRAWPRPTRRRAAAAAIFVVWHITSALIWGAGPEMRRRFEPIFWPYGAALKLSQSWGMFAAVDEEKSVRLSVGYADGTVRLVSPPASEELWRRIVEQRERKFLSHLNKEPNRVAWGETFLLRFCRADGDERFPRWVRLEIAKTARAAEGFETFLKKSCPGGGRNSP